MVATQHLVAVLVHLVVGSFALLPASLGHTAVQRQHSVQQHLQLQQCYSSVPPTAVHTHPLHKAVYFSAAVTIGVSILLPSAAEARVLTQAPDLEMGAKTFASVCSACHLGGYNAVNPAKTLQLKTLQVNGMFAADAIEYQVTNGKNNMPAFGGRLSEDDITNAAYYVVFQAQEGWNKKPLYVNYPSKYVPGNLASAYK